MDGWIFIIYAIFSNLVALKINFAISIIQIEKICDILLYVIFTVMFLVKMVKKIPLSNTLFFSIKLFSD